MPTLRIVASVILDDSGRMLLVRKRGTSAFMQPGGKLEPGETPAQALVRELGEELGMSPVEADLVHLGRFDAPAANEPDHLVDCDVFVVPAPASTPAPLAEIEEARWVDVLGDNHGLTLAPLITAHMVPLLRAGSLERTAS